MTMNATRPAHAPRLRATANRSLATITVAALVATALVPRLTTHTTTLAAFLAAAFVSLAVAVWIVRRNAQPGRSRFSLATAGQATLGLALYLSPVLLLTIVFPVISPRIATAQVGGASLTSLLLASSLSVPWLSQAVCFPLYRAIGPLISDGDQFQIAARFTQVWPAAFAQSAPVILVFAVPVELVMHWSPVAIGAYLVLCLLHVAFVQSLIPTNVGRRRVLWAAAWFGYAAALFIVPTWLFLPPLVGLLTQVISLRAHLTRMTRPVVLDVRDLVSDLSRGVLLGAVLWSDKFFLYLRGHGHFEVSAVFMAMLPAVLAYNYYFVRLAPAFDTSVGSLRSAMQHAPYAILANRSAQVRNTVQTSIGKTAVLGACLSLALTVVVSRYTPYPPSLVAPVALASWLFMMTTVLCYKLDYAGKSGAAQAYSAAHLVVCGGAFLLLPAGANIYAWIFVFEAAIFAAALRSCMYHWQSAEYTLFWRHATAW